MCAWPNSLPANPLVSGSDGELVQVQISVPAQLLEELLECLSELSFPINPQLYHGVPTLVEFPAWESRLFEVRDALRRDGFDPAGIRVRSMIQEIAG